MLIMPKSCFFHVPKTGGTWATKALKASVPASEEFMINDDPHIGLMSCPCPEKFKIAFVRNPVERYMSYWKYKMGAGWDLNNQFDKDCCSSDFKEFVQNILNFYPGICGKNYDYYVGTLENEIDFIGKYENLVEDLILALKMAGENFNEDVIRNFKPLNVSDHARFHTNVTPELEKAIRNSERYAIERFGYDLHFHL